MSVFYDYINYFERFPFEFSIPLVVLLVALACNAVCRSRSAAIVLTFLASFSISLIAAFCFGTGPETAGTMIGENLRLVEFVLVPPIIFDCAFTLDPHDFNKFGWQVFILIVPCFLLSTLLLGCFVFIYWYDALSPNLYGLLSFRIIFRLSGYLSAIDPVTVSAVIDELDISHQLTALLKFEALLSQASAAIFSDIMKIDVLDPSKAISGIAEEIAGIVGVVVLGYVYGRALASIQANLLYIDYVAEGGMVFVMVYLSYATGVVCGTSGALCLVVFAITFNGCRNAISQRAYDDMKCFWGTTANCAHGIIVGFVGIAAGQTYKIAVGEHAIMLALFPFSILCRFVSILIFTPLLRYAGGFELEFVVIFVAAGLRGVLSLLPTGLSLISLDYGLVAYVEMLKAVVAGVLTVVILSQLIQGLCLGPIAKCLGLRIESRLQPEFMRSLANRVNTHLRQNIKQRKKLKENADIMWELIEKELLFNFTADEGGDKGPQKPDKKAEESCSRQKYELTEEIEARERVRRCYEAQVRKNWQIYGRTTSVASRVVENAISDAVVNRRALDIERLFDSLQPHPIWRRLAESGRKRIKLLRVKRILDQLSIYGSFWRWRLFVCIVTSAAAAFFVYISATKKSETRADFMFLATLVSLVVSIEQTVRLSRLIQKFRRSSPRGPIVKEIWFWYEVILLFVQLTTDAVHLAIVLGKCIDRGLGYVHWTRNQFCRDAQLAMMIADLLPLLQIPLIIGLLLRLFFSEIESFVQTRDEETFEAVSTLLTVTDTVLRLLAGRFLVHKPTLRKKLSEETLMTKSALEDKLVELLNRQGGEATLANIKTRQVAREVIEEVAALLVEAKASGALGEVEYSCMDSIVDEKRSKMQQDRLEEEPTGVKSTSDADLEILSNQLRQMDWMRAADGQAEVTEVIDYLKQKGRLQKVTKKVIIISDGDTPKEWGVYILLHGFCRGVTYDLATEETKTRLIHAGTMFGENGSLGEPYVETVAAASPKVLVFWISSKAINELPPAVYEAFNKHMVKKACADYLRREERYHAWSDEMSHEHVRLALKSTKAGGTVPEEFRVLILFKGVLIDADGKKFTATPYRPIKIGVYSDRMSFQEPLTVLEKGGVAYYIVSRTESKPSTGETSDEVSDSFMLASTLVSDVSRRSPRSKKSKKSKSTESLYKKFKPLYTKMKKEQ